MTRVLLLLSILIASACAMPEIRAVPTLTEEQPVLIAHRGASGERPEHTLAAYELAIEQGADFIEPDLVLTKDGVLVARHENEISETTDVADRPEFAERKVTKTIDGREYEGWFTEDFTLAELKTLRAKERLPQLRGANSAYDGRYEIPTLEEILQLVQRIEQESGKRIGLYPETKHPGYFVSIGLPHEQPLLEMLAKFGFDSADDPLFIQSFEVGNLRALAPKTELRLVQLMASEGGPADRPEISYSDMLSANALTEIATYADGIGPSKDLVIARNALGNLAEPTGLVERAHAAGLLVHPWTFRAENYFLPLGAKSGIDPAGRGDLTAEIEAFVAAGVDGLFSDHVAEARAAIDAD